MLSRIYTLGFVVVGILMGLLTSQLSADPILCMDPNEESINTGCDDCKRVVIDPGPPPVYTSEDCRPGAGGFEMDMPCEIPTDVDYTICVEYAEDCSGEKNTYNTSNCTGVGTETEDPCSLKWIRGESSIDETEQVGEPCDIA